MAVGERLSTDEVEAFFSAGTERERVLADEILERREADLTAEEREALRWARDALKCDGLFEPQSDDPIVAKHTRNCRAALTVLDRLLGQGERRPDVERGIQERAMRDGFEIAVDHAYICDESQCEHYNHISHIDWSDAREELETAINQMRARLAGEM